MNNSKISKYRLIAKVQIYFSTVLLSVLLQFYGEFRIKQNSFDVGKRQLNKQS